MKESNPVDHEHVIELLQKMGEQEANYPLDLLMQQQELFLTKAAAAHAQTAATSAGAAAAKGTLLQTTLGAILVVELIVGHTSRAICGFRC